MGIASITMTSCYEQNSIKKNGPDHRGHFALVVMTMLDDDDLLAMTMMPAVIHVVMSVLDNHCLCRGERRQGEDKS